MKTQVIDMLKVSAAVIGAAMLLALIAVFTTDSAADSLSGEGTSLVDQYIDDRLKELPAVDDSPINTDIVFPWMARNDWKPTHKEALS